MFRSCQIIIRELCCSLLKLYYNIHNLIRIKLCSIVIYDRLCGLVVRVSGYRYRGPGFDPRRYQIF